MNCNFPEYPVSKREDANSKLAGKLWNLIVEDIKSSILSKKNIVMSIVGQPGMGKTSILNAVEAELSDSFIIYLDLASGESLAKEAWFTVRNRKILDKIKVKAFQILNEHKREIGYDFLAKLGKEFTNWLRHLCEKKKWDEKWGYAERLYCLEYSEDINGFISFINDLVNLGKVGILIDELKANDVVLSELHKLINSVKIPIVVTLVPEVFNDIKDSALRRRLDEYKKELYLTEEDKKEILKAYCPDFAEELYSQVNKADTVSKLIDIARTKLQIAEEECEDEIYKKEECIRRKLSNFEEIKDIDIVSRKLEDAIRKGLRDLKDKLGLFYVHERGKRIDEKHVIVDIYFIKDEVAYLGDVKLSNEQTLIGIDNMKKLEDLTSYEGRQVKKFIVTNVPNVDLNGFKIILIDGETINEIINGNVDKRNELVERIIRELD